MRAQASAAHGASDMAAAYEQPSPRDTPDSPRYATPLGMGTEPGRLPQEIAGAADRQGDAMATEARGRVRAEDGPKRAPPYPGGGGGARTHRPHPGGGG